MTKPVIKRTKEQREADMNTLSKLYVKGVSQMQIAKELGISQGQVSSDLRKLLKHWEETRLDEIDRYKHEQLIRINLIEEEMWTAWENSKKSGKKTLNKGKSGKIIQKIDPLTGVTNKKEGDEEYWRVNEQEEVPVAGDMQYMNGIMWCQQERAKIIGLYAPKKVAATDPTGTQEAGVSAKEELMGMLSGIVKRMNPAKEEEEYVEGVLVSSLEADTDKQVTDSDMSDLARRLQQERIRRLPAPIEYDDEGNILVSAE